MMNTDITLYEEQESWWSRFWTRRRAKKAAKQIRKSMLGLESQWVRFESYSKLYEEHQTLESYQKLSKHWESMVEQAASIIALCKMHVISVPLTADIAASSVLPKENPSFRSTVDSPLGYQVQFDNPTFISVYAHLVQDYKRMKKFAQDVCNKNTDLNYISDRNARREALGSLAESERSLVQYETSNGTIITK